MANRLSTRLTYTTITIVALALIGAGSVAVAGVTDQQGRIKACYVKKGEDRGDLRLRVKGGCTSKEKGIKWARRGPAGPQGPPGVVPVSSWITVGGAGAPAFKACDLGPWSNFNTTTNNAASFSRDGFGFVHLRGTVTCASDLSTQDIFDLPPGYRPARNEQFPTIAGPTGVFNGIAVNTAGQIKPALSTGTAHWISLDGITFRCAPAGVNGCP